MADIETAVLSEELQKRIRGRKVNAAVFTTFQFEPGFFEEDILPLLFEQSFSHVTAIRLIELEEALQSIEEVAVYYDRRGLRTSGPSARLDVRRIPLERQGYFHPKLILLLVGEETEEDGYWETLIVGVLSANLTRAGWWENLESAWFGEFADGDKCSIRTDLLRITRLLRAEEKTGEKHHALDRIYPFVRHRLEEMAYRSSQSVLHPRLFYGQEGLGAFLAEHLGIEPDTFNLEVISPYFDDTKEAGTLRSLIEELSPKETRVFLPIADDGAALCREPYYEAIEALPGTRWSRLPGKLVQRSQKEKLAAPKPHRSARAKAGSETERFVHAKVYRLWSQSLEREYLLVGSVNLTHAAHGRNNAGNLEVAVLIDNVFEGALRFWLDPLEDEAPETFRVEKGEESPVEEAPPPLSLRHHWDRARTEYFWESRRPPKKLEFWTAGSPVGAIRPVTAGKWTAASGEFSTELSERLKATSFVEVSVDGGPRASILVREEGMAHKPSILMTLTAEEILRYWSLLSPEQRQAFLANKAHAFLVREGVVSASSTPLVTADSLFDRFAGIFHAFSRLREHVSEAIDDGCEKEAEYRLFGQKYDSLPSLLDRVLAEEDSDLVNRYVTFLTARDAFERLYGEYPDFFREHRRETRSVRKQLEGVERLRTALSFGESEERARFVDWFERTFFTDMAPSTRGQA